MALKPCRECQKEISSEAKSCPNCGCENPTESKPCRKCAKMISSQAIFCPDCGCNKPFKEELSKRQKITRTIFWVATLSILLSFCSSDHKKTKKETPKKTAEQKAAEDAACRKDLQCFGDKAIIGASVYCKSYIEKFAKYSSEWTDGTFELKFSRYRWLNKDNGFITVIGDKIKFQNGFGAWQNYIYECDFAPDTNTVIDVRVEPGKL